jgi:hypothetical protein
MRLPQKHYRIVVRNLRGAARAPTLDEEGFTLCRHVSGVSDYDDPRQTETRYAREMEELVAEVTGARLACAVPQMIMRSAEHAGAWGDVMKQPPAQVVHSDFGATSARRQAEQWFRQRGVTFSEEGRLAVFNVWRSLRPPPQDVPLAVCDRRSVDPADLVAADVVGGRPFAAAEHDYILYRHSRHHRWFYYRDMMPDEVLIFTQHDSGVVQPSACPHVGFEDPTCPPGTPPRLSIEARVFALFA